MQDGIHTRLARVTDAADIVAVHWSAVHGSAQAAYPATILDQWSPPVDAGRVATMAAVIAGGREIVHVAIAAGRVRGFGSIEPATHCLKAIYVHADCSRAGLGTALMRALEQLARSLGLGFLAMDASVNAEAFYLRQGFRCLERGVHRLSSGDEMACVRMRKDFA
jgi:GNAT superfamily N-acetyltransferase